MSSFKFRRNIKKIRGGSSRKFTLTKTPLTAAEIEEMPVKQQEENKRFRERFDALKKRHANEKANENAKKTSESGGGGAAAAKPKPKAKSTTATLRRGAASKEESSTRRRVSTTKHNSNSEEPIIINMEVFNHPDICRKVLEEYIIREQKTVGEAQKLQDELEETIKGREHSSYRQMRAELLKLDYDYYKEKLETCVKQTKQNNGNAFKMPEWNTLQPSILLSAFLFSPKRDDIQEEVINVLNGIPSEILVGKISIKRKGQKKKPKRKAQKKKKETKGESVKKRTKKNL